METIIADVTQDGALTDWLAELDKRSSVELVIVNAGVFEGRREDETVEALDRGIAVLRVNLEGAVRTVAAVLPGMLRRRSGRIVLVSSLAALMPQADAAAYSRKAYAAAWIGPDAGIEADAITLGAYMGSGSLTPVVARALSECLGRGPETRAAPARGSAAPESD